MPWFSKESEVLGLFFGIDSVEQPTTMQCVVASKTGGQLVHMGSEVSIKAWITQFRKGLAELCVLQAVEKLGEVYGYQLVSFLSEQKGLGLTESTVYPLLARLAREGRLDATSRPSPSGPPRRYYKITKAGEEALEQMDQQLEMFLASIASIRG